MDGYPFWYAPFGHVNPDRVFGNAMRTKTICLVRSIVDKYGGTVEVNRLNDEFTINIPEEYRVQCDQEVSDALATL